MFDFVFLFLVVVLWCGVCEDVFGSFFDDFVSLFSILKLGVLMLGDKLWVVCFVVLFCMFVVYELLIGFDESIESFLCG